MDKNPMRTVTMDVLEWEVLVEILEDAGVQYGFNGDTCNAFAQDIRYQAGF
jgi:hypothetical protein